MDPLNYQYFHAARTDIFSLRLSVYWMIGPFQLSRAGYAPVRAQSRIVIYLTIRLHLFARVFYEVKVDIEIERSNLIVLVESEIKHEIFNKKLFLSNILKRNL